jgi:hypothetical protein
MVAFEFFIEIVFEVELLSLKMQSLITTGVEIDVM